MDSVLPHLAQIAHCSQFGTLFHLLPILYAWCIVLYRNCCILILRIGFRVPDHIVVSVSFVPLVLSIASLAACRFPWASGCGGCDLLFLMPWYAVAWFIVASLAPGISSLCFN